MSSIKCAKCEQTVYPVEAIRCLDKTWHKGCFKCHECNMTLSLKNYKGFEKRPYCNAHCPQAKATTVADTPEIRRLAENTRIQSQAKYHEDFEKSKGKGFTAIADDPETLRIKNTSKIISNVAYHGELERKKQMEEKRGLSGPTEVQMNDGNTNKHSNRMTQNQTIHHNHNPDYPTHQTNNNNYQQNSSQYQVQNQPQLLHQQQLQKQQQQQFLKQQQMQYAQDLNGQQIVNRQSLHLEGPIPSSIKHVQQQQYSASHNQQQQQQQMMMMHQQQKQHQLMMQQQQRQSFDPNLNRQQLKQSNNNHPQQLIKNQQMIPNHHQQAHPMKYMPINDAAVGGHQNSPPHHLIGGAPHVMNSSQLGGMPNGSQRVSVPPNAAMVGPQGPHHMVHGYGHPMSHPINGPMPKQQHQQQPFVVAPPQQQRHMIHPSQMQPMNHPQIRPQQMLPPQQQLQQQHPQQRMPRRVYRAMFDYVAHDVDEVSFFENDILVDCMNVDGNWFVGKVARSGATGMLPANYVEELPSQ